MKTALTLLLDTESEGDFRYPHDLPLQPQMERQSSIENTQKTPAQHTARQKRELDAQPASDLIDEDIKQERGGKTKNIIRTLLLGQAESGTS